MSNEKSETPTRPLMGGRKTEPGRLRTGKTGKVLGGALNPEGRFLKRMGGRLKRMRVSKQEKGKKKERGEEEIQQQMTVLSQFTLQNAAAEMVRVKCRNRLRLRFPRGHSTHQGICICPMGRGGAGRICCWKKLKGKVHKHWYARG